MTFLHTSSVVISLCPPAHGLPDTSYATGKGKVHRARAMSCWHSVLGLFYFSLKKYFHSKLFLHTALIIIISLCCWNHSQVPGNICFSPLSLSLNVTQHSITNWCAIIFNEVDYLWIMLLSMTTLKHYANWVYYFFFLCMKGGLFRWEYWWRLIRHYILLYHNNN